VSKTPLAVRVAEEVADAFPDGVGFMPLAAILDPALVLPTIAQALGVRDGMANQPLQRIGVDGAELEYEERGSGSHSC
jgi:predicted ATPase